MKVFYRYHGVESVFSLAYSCASLVRGKTGQQQVALMHAKCGLALRVMVATVLRGLLAALMLGTTSAGAASVFPVSDVVAQIKRELVAAQNTPGAGLVLVLEKVETTLFVSRSVEANGKVSIGVPVYGVEGQGGGSRKYEESSSLYVELVPPRPVAFQGAVESSDFGLTQAIVETRRELLAGLAGEPRLDPRKVVITVKFGISRSAAAAGSLKFVVVSAGAGARLRWPT